MGRCGKGKPSAQTERKSERLSLTPLCPGTRISLFVVVVVIFFLPRIKTWSGRPFVSGGGFTSNPKDRPPTFEYRKKGARGKKTSPLEKKKEISPPPPPPPPPLFLSVLEKIYARAKTKRMIVVINALTLINIHSFSGFNYKTGTKKS